MDISAATQGRRWCSPVVDRKLDELCACLDGALSSSRQQRSRPYYSEERLRAEIKAKTDFLRSLLAAEAECHGGGARPEHLAEAEARFAVLEATFDQWARRASVDAPEPIEENDEDDGDDGCSGSSCSCTDSCHEAKEEGNGGAAAKRDATVEALDEEGMPDGGIAKDSDDGANKERKAAAEEMRRKRRWWRPSAASAWCGAAGVVAVVAAVGLAVELLAAVAHHNVSVYVVPT